MGVSGGMSSILSFEPKRRYLEKYKHKGMFVVIDARNILCKLGIGWLNTETYIVNKKKQNVIEIYICMIVAYKYLAEGIIPIFVFDGASSADDPDTRTKRQNRKQKARDHIEEIVKNTEVDSVDAMNDDEETEKMDIDNEEEIEEENHPDVMEEERTKIFEVIEEIVMNEMNETDQDETKKNNLTNYIKYLKQSFQLKTKNIEEGKKLLRKMGVRVVDAPGKADPQCAAIAHVYAKNVIGVITDDFDLLMYLSTNILIMPSLGSNYLEEYSMEDTLQHLRNMMINVINTTSDQEIKEKYRGKSIEFSHENLIEIGCMMGNDHCPGLKTKKYKDKADERPRIEIILELYAKNDMSLQKVLEKMKNVLSREYIAKMQCAKEKFRSAPIYHPEKLKLWLKKPKPNEIRKICSEIIDSESIERMISVIEDTYEKHIKNPHVRDENDEKFGSFLSYRRKYNMNRERDRANYHNNKIWPEPMWKLPITIPSHMEYAMD